MRMTPREIPLCVSAAERLLELAGPDLLWQMFNDAEISCERFFRGGFQVSATGLRSIAVRRRIAVALARDAALAGRLLLVSSAPWQLWLTGLACFSDTWLRSVWRRFLRTGGGVVLALAMSCDERPRIRRRGERLLLREGFWQHPPETDSERLSRSLLQALPGLAETATGSDETAVLSGNSPGGGPRENRELEEVRRSLDAHRHKLKEARQELRQMSVTYGSREKNLESENRVLRQELAHLEETVAARIETAVAALAKDLLRVTPELETVVQENDTSTAGLLTKAASILRKQREMDRRNGLISRLREDHDRLEKTEAELACAINDSVLVLPELRRIHTDVCNRLRELDALLAQHADTPFNDGLETYLMACIRGVCQSSENQEDLDAVDVLLAHGLLAEFLGAVQTARLTAASAERRAFLEECLREKLSRPAVLIPSQHTRTEPREIWDLPGALEKSTKDGIGVRLFVDGYNAIRRVRPLSGIENRNGLAVARSTFLDLIRRRQEAFTTVEVVFDGTGTLSQREADGNLTLVYSGSLTESQNADIYLTARLHALAGTGGQVWLVTDDFGLRDHVRTCCQAYIPPLRLYEYLSG